MRWKEASAALLRILIWAAFALLTGCGNGDVASLPTWTLSAPGHAPSAVHLPRHFAADLAPVPQTYTLTTTYVLSPPLRERALTLIIRHLPADVSLRVNGAPVLESHRDQEILYRTRGLHAFPIAAGGADESGRLELEIEVRHEWSQSAWLDSVPYMTAAPGGDTSYRVIRTINDVLVPIGTGATMMISFSYGFVFLIDRRRVAHGWVTVQGLGAIVYCFFTMGLTQLLFGRYDFAVSLVALCVAIYASTNFTHAFYKLAPASRLWALPVLIAIVTAIGFGGPFVVVRSVLVVAAVAIVFGTGYQIALLTRMVVRPGRPSTAPASLAAWAFLALPAGTDLAAHLGIADPLGVRIAPLGIAVFGGFQSVVLSYAYFGVLTESERLNRDLAGQVSELANQRAEVATLNEELRCQVLARSEQLSDALLRLASAEGEPVVLAEGDVIENRYRVIRAIGAGGMGVVYEVRRVSDGVRLALKVLSGRPSVSELARFAREARLAATISHPNVVRVLDTAVAAQGYLFLVIEFVEGQSINQRRERFGDVSWALRVLAGVARGLAAVHAAGIVHRDIKPGNVMVREDSSGAPVEVKLTDFGISNVAGASTGGSDSGHSSRDGASAGGRDDDTPKLHELGLLAPHPSVERPPREEAVEASPSGSRPGRVDPARVTTARDLQPSSSVRPPASLTRAGTVLGTPSYMAPEAFGAGRQQLTASDVYSLGVLAFELLHRRLPFTETEAVARAYGYFEGEVPSFGGLKLPAHVTTLLDATLSSEVTERPEAGPLADGLEQAAAVEERPSTMAQGPTVNSSHR